MDEPVRVSVDGSVMTLTLNRPESGNAFDLTMGTAILSAATQLAEAAREGTVRSAVLAAEGKSFCVGGDLAYFSSAGDDRGRLLQPVARALHDAILALTSAPIPIVTALHATVAGGGIGLALAGDVVIASHTAKFRLAYTGVGLSPDCGASWLLPRRIGTARALDLALTNRLLTATEAENWGLVTRLAAPDDVLAEATKLATELSTGPRASLAATKHLVWGGCTADFRQQLEDESRSISHLANTPDGQEGMNAFLAKRRPRFG